LTVDRRQAVTVRCSIDERSKDMAVDTTGSNAFLGRFVSDLGATVAAGGVVVGHRLGLYRALAARPGRPR
jgi:hypothetical protein